VALLDSSRRVLVTSGSLYPPPDDVVAGTFVVFDFVDCHSRSPLFSLDF